MIIDVARYSCSGGHEINEDSLLCEENVWAVADGLGGHENGEKASAAAVEFLKKNCRGNYTDDEIRRLIDGANAAVMNTEGEGRSTIAAVFAENGTFRMANVGDSRVYFFRKGRIIAQTKDHSVCQAAVDMGTMSFSEIRGSEDRASLLKVLGNDEKLNIRNLYPPVEVSSGDAFVICSDGFWEYVYEEEMEADFLKAENAEEWMTFMLKRHMLRSKNEGDNYSVICGLFRLETEDENLPATIAPAKAGSEKKLIIAAACICILCVIAAAMFNSAREEIAVETDEETVVTSDETSDTVLSVSSDSEEDTDEETSDGSSSEISSDDEQMSSTGEETDLSAESSETGVTEVSEEAEETTKETPNETTGEITKESTEETTKESTEETTKESTEETTGETTKESTEETTGKTTKESTEETTGETTKENTEETTGETTKENTEETKEKTPKEKTEETIGKNTEKPPADNLQ